MSKATYSSPADSSVQPGQGTGPRSTGEHTSRSAERPVVSQNTETVGSAIGEGFVRGDGEYTVVKGDTLSKIAAMNRIDGGWRKLFQLNRDIVATANLIYPGQQLRLT